MHCGRFRKRSHGNHRAPLLQLNVLEKWEAAQIVPLNRKATTFDLRERNE